MFKCLCITSVTDSNKIKYVYLIRLVVRMLNLSLANHEGNVQLLNDICSQYSSRSNLDANPGQTTVSRTP